MFGAGGSSSTKQGTVDVHRGGKALFCYKGIGVRGILVDIYVVFLARYVPICVLLSQDGASFCAYQGGGRLVFNLIQRIHPLTDCKVFG